MIRKNTASLVSNSVPSPGPGPSPRPAPRGRHYATARVRRRRTSARFPAPSGPAPLTVLGAGGLGRVAHVGDVSLIIIHALKHPIQSDADDGERIGQGTEL